MGQLAHLEKDLPTDPIKSSTEMAPGRSRPCCSPRQNLSFINPVENELARDSGSVGGFHLSNTSLAPSHNPTPGPKLVPTLIPAPIPAPAPPSFDELFKQFMRAYLESNQGASRPPAERKRSLKAKVLDVYYRKLHIDCYYFCQQCENHFETAGATGAN